MMVEPVVRLDGVSRTFDSTPPVEALKPTDLIIERGEYVAIVGPSGSGKSTLLHLLGLLDTPTSGTYWLDGIDTSTLSEAHRAGLRGARIGFVFQAFHLLAHRTTVENVAMAELYSTQSRHDRTERAVLALERVGLGHRLETFPTTLSGGERQRVALARAVVGSPSLVLADEPTGNLDSVTTEAVMSMFADLHRTGITLAVITHDPDVAKGAQRQIQIRDGTVTGGTVGGGMVSGGTVTGVTVGGGPVRGGMIGGGPVTGGPAGGHDPDVASGPTVTD